MEKIPCIRCNDKLFAYMKPFLQRWGYDIKSACLFNTFPYLVLNADGVFGECTSITSRILTAYDRELITDVEEFLERAAELKGFTYKKGKKDMKLKDLKPGMVVKTREGKYFLVLEAKGKLFFSNIIYWTDSTFYTEDLTFHNKAKSEADIIEVFLPNEAFPISVLLQEDVLKSIWKREDEKVLEVTMDEIAEKFGVKEIRIKP